MCTRIFRFGVKSLLALKEPFHVGRARETLVKRFVLSLLLISLPAFPPPVSLGVASFGENGPRTLLVYIYDGGTKKPISDAIVSVYFYENGTLTKEATTDMSGYATLSLSTGDYYLKVRCAGCLDDDHILLLTQDAELQVPMTKRGQRVSGIDSGIIVIVAVAIFVALVLLVRRRTPTLKQKQYI
jgi:hypothetical protein